MTTRGPPRGSHLRQVSTGSTETVKGDQSYHGYDGSQADVQTIRSPTTHDSPPMKLHNGQCLLWVHDEKFSKDEILFNPHIFPESSVAVGDLVEVKAVGPNSDVRDFQQKYDSKLQGPGEDRSSKRHAGSAVRTNPGAKLAVPAEHALQQDNNAHGPDRHKHCIFVVKPFPPEFKAKHPGLQLSITNSVANAFGLRNRSQVMLSVVERSDCTASHAEVVFRDEYLSRADMWRLTISELTDRPVYKGQKILFMGTIKATIKSLYVNGRKESSAYFSSQTIPIFRSESARFVIFIQMSREMWDFDSEGTGEIMFNRVVNGFLPELFKRWQKSNARHLVSIVMFTRVEYDRRVTAQMNTFISETESLFGSSKTKAPTQRLKDFYRVVVSDMSSGQWTLILNELKKEFRTFLRDVTIHDIEVDTLNYSSPQKSLDQEKPKSLPVISGWPTTALRGNILEAINIASSQFSSDYIDRDLVRTGISAIVVTAGTGVFEVDPMALARTTENLTNNGIGIDLVCLSKMPLHSVPLFKFRKPQSRFDPSTKSIARGSIRAQSPPPAYSPMGSFPSQILDISPSATTEFGSMTGPPSKIMSLESPDEWDYHIPQWIDISFWASDSGSNRRNAGSGSTSRGRQSHQKEFVPRVRMYELQMMGVMENEMSNIFIPYLFEDVPALASSSNPLRTRNRFLNIGSDTGQHRASSRSPHRSRISSPLAHSPSFKDSGIKKRLQSSQPDQEKGLDWMDVYDDLVFRPFRKPKTGKSNRDPNRKPKAGDQRHGDPSFQAASDQTSESDDNAQRRDPTANQSAQKTQALSNPDQAPKPHTSTVLGTKKAKTGNDVKPARISRQISFALRGLGLAAPRAVASTEVHVEHANAAKPVSGTSTSKILAPGAKTLPIENAPTPATAGNQDKSLRPTTSTTTSKAQNLSVNNSGNSPSRPISIRNTKNDILEQSPGAAEGGHSFSTATTQVPVETKNIDIPHKDSKETGVEQRKKHQSNLDETNKTGAPEKRPWIRTVNPCNPAKNDPKATAAFGRWQHVYPHAPRAASMKWKSLCSPAAVPLTTEDFPSEEELSADYAQIKHQVFQNEDKELSEVPKPRYMLMHDLISIRLSHGYQIVVGAVAIKARGHLINVFDIESLAQEGSVVLMSMGNTVQKLVCGTGGRVSVIKYTRRPLPELLDPTNQERSFTFFAAIRTILAQGYIPREMRVEDLNEAYDWNLVDSFIAGHRNSNTDYIEQLRFWRARFVLLPVDLPPNTRRSLHSLAEDTEEEVRLEGIRKITQIWQRYRYTHSDERKFQSSLRKRKDSNPLDILYQTRNPSEVIAAELDKSLLTDVGIEGGPTQLLPDSELLQRSNINLSTLAQIIQGEKGITIINRRWHWRLHYSCFIGVELTSWLLQNFRDIETREEAVEFGNELMKNGLFQHVEKRHNFRDGNYFYQIGADYRGSRPDVKSSGWFQSRRPDRSVPSTPLSEALLKDSPLASRSRSSSNNEDDTTDSSVPTPTKLTRSRVAVNLSKSMRYDVDHRKRSKRSEIIELHYDRIHNPDNCYHFRIDWINVTSKFIEDAIVTWATTADKYGLKLVEVPMAEASTISEKEPFRSPYVVRLKVPPPNGRSSGVFNSTSFSPQGNVDRAFYQKAILKKFNFVLDLEAASDFPPDVDVSYSWGKPTYRYPQYIHRSGVLLAQIREDGCFLLTANRLYNTRSAASKEAARLEREEYFYRRPKAYGELEKVSPHPSPLVRAIPDVLGGGHAHFDMSHISTTPEHIAYELEAFCNDTDKLTAFYDTTSAKASPAPATALLDASIPSLRLPPSVIRRDVSPIPNPDALKAGNSNSVHSGQSPRGSMGGYSYYSTG